MHKGSGFASGLLLFATAVFISHGAAASESAGLSGLAGAHASPVPVPPPGVVSRSPYLGAILVDAATGKVLSEDNANAPCYPASMVKLMNLLIILEMVDSGGLHLQDPVPVTAAASKIGGSQVYLKEKEVFSIDELLYALIIQSANDAAAALAIHIAGTKEAFVDMMNRRARELGMTNTRFHSVHGLPPGRGQEPDVSTARDIAKLSVELMKHERALAYTSETERTFRADSGNPFIMRTHNHLLGTFDGCDGLKTGYYRKAGYSISATASRRGARAIAVVVGSTERKVRDAKTRELLSRGLVEILGSSPSVARETKRPAQQGSNLSAGLGAQPAASSAGRGLSSADKGSSPAASGDKASKSGPAGAGGGSGDDVIRIPKKHLQIAGVIIVAACVPAFYFRIRGKRRRRNRRIY